jgi:MFS superfamily sulfate permease-like transporter
MPSIAGSREIGVKAAAPRSGLAKYVSLFGGILPAGFLFFARLARLGFLANFISQTVLVGFLTGVGIQVAMGQLAGCWGCRPRRSIRAGRAAP